MRYASLSPLSSPLIIFLISSKVLFFFLHTQFYFTQNGYLSRGRFLHRRSATAFNLLFLGFLNTLGKQLLVFSFGFTRSFGSSALNGLSTSLVLKSTGSDKTLDLGSLGVSLLAFSLGLDFTANDILANIVFLG